MYISAPVVMQTACVLLCFVFGRHNSSGCHLQLFHLHQSNLMIAKVVT